jgi:hypothetical protein
MANIVNIPFVGPAYESRSPNVNAQRCVNWYLEAGGPGAKNPIALYGTPGLLEFSDVGGDGMRGMYHVPSKNLFTVSGDKFKEVNRVGVVTERGTLNSTTGRVSMADNGTQIMIVDGVDGYIYNLDTEVFVQITDPDFPGADTVDFIDQYFAVNKPDTGRWYVSALLNGLDWTATDFVTAESSSDNLSAVINADDGTLVSLGRYTSEIWYNAAASGNPFARVAGGIMNWGIDATFSLVKGDETLFWLARNLTGDKIVVRKEGFNARRISTNAIEFAMSEMTTTSDAIAYMYTEQGHTFYVLTFPTGNQTWVYDLSTGVWHERSSYKITGEIRHRSNAYFFFAGSHMVGDFESGKIYKMNTDFLDDAGDPIKRTRATQHLHNLEKRVSYLSLQVDMQVGVGEGLGQGKDPRVMLRWSDDGGHTWSNEKWRDIGKIGEFKKRIIWNRLGASRDRIFELSITDPVKAALIGATANIEAMAA